VPLSDPDDDAMALMEQLHRAWRDPHPKLLTQQRVRPVQQIHVAGKKLFIDHTDTTNDIGDGTTEEAHAANHSSPYSAHRVLRTAEASFTQTLPDF
jgi:hypothetical protein